VVDQLSQVDSGGSPPRAKSLLVRRIRCAPSRGSLARTVAPPRGGRRAPRAEGAQSSEAATGDGALETVAAAELLEW
jgi:hypothetical protein